jgi:hypothetical protein
MQYLSSVRFVSHPLHVSGIFAAHHQEVYFMYTTIGTFCAFQLTVGQVAEYIYSITPDDWLQICPKHVEVD